MGLIFWLSSIPDLRSSWQPMWDLILRKFAHVGEYAVLAVLSFAALRASGVSRRRALWFGFLIASVYAMTDEYHQTFVAGRHGTPVDWLIDTLGAGVGILWLARRWNK